MEAPTGEPDRVLPIPAVAGLEGEICLWGGGSWLPPQDSYLFQFLVEQVAQSLDWVQPDWKGRPSACETETWPDPVSPSSSPL